MEFLQNYGTAKGQYYSELLDLFASKFRDTRTYSDTNLVLFHHDNSPAQSPRIDAAKLHEHLY